MTLLPDTRTLAIAVAMTLLIQFQFLFYHQRNARTYPGFKAWVVSGALGFLGVLLLGLRGFIPDVVSIVIAHTILGAGILTLVAGMYQFAGRAVSPAPYIAIGAVVFLLHAFWTVVAPSYIARTILFATTYATASALCYDITTRHLLAVLPTGNRMLASVFLLQAVWYTSRVVMLIAGLHMDQDFMAPSWFNASMLLAQVGFSTAILVGFVVLNAQRVEQDLIQARNEVRTLQGIIPICAWCKKVRHDTGAWEQIDQYVQAHTDVNFSHGICPECMPRFFGQASDTLPSA